MRRVLLPIFVWMNLAAAAHAQRGYGTGPGMMGPITDAPLVEIKGTILRVRIVPGQGMPSIVVKSPDDEAAILLGPMWFLMAEDFNPKVGEEVVVKAYETRMGLVAATVSLPASKKTLRLRDGEGRPVWQPGRGRGRNGNAAAFRPL